MTRYYVRVVTIILLVMIISAIVLNRFAEKVSEDYLRPRAIREMTLLAGKLQKRLGDKPLEQAERELENLESKLNFSTRLVSLASLQSEMVDASEQVDAANGTDALPRIFLRLGNEPFVLEIRPAEGLDRRLEEKEGLLVLLGLIVVFLIVIGAGYFLVSPLVRRLRAQEVTIGRIADGDLTARVKIEGNDALNRLGRRINQMADKIQELLSSQQHLLQAVSHEMRTPTARIGFALEMLEDARTGEERHRRIQALQDDLLELDNLLEELLTFLRFEEGAQKMETAPVELAPFVDAAVERARRLYPEVTISAELPDSPLSGNVSERYFPRVLDNILTNAARHARSQVQVFLFLESRRSVVHIADDGPGIPPSDRERVFEPFTRLDKSRTKRSGGAGLGLAIAKRVIEHHNGKITVRDSALGGAMFRIEVPAA